MEIRCVKYVHQLGDGRWRVTFTDGTHTNRARLIAGIKVGRAVTRSEIVHHRNGDCSDDRLENLEVMSASSHARWHNANPRPRVQAAAASVVAVSARIPYDLMEELRVVAKQNERSINAEISYRLRKSVEGYKRI